MPKVKLQFDIRGWITQTVDLPQSVIDEYERQVGSDDPDCRAIDRLLMDHIRYDDFMDQLDDPEDIELTQIKSEESVR